MDYEYFKKLIDDYKIVQIDLPNPGASLTSKKGIIFINENDSLDVQVRALMREAVQFHPRFIEYTAARFNRRTSIDKKIEQQIFDLSQEYYRKNHQLKKYAEDRIRTSIACYRPLK